MLHSKRVLLRRFCPQSGILLVPVIAGTGSSMVLEFTADQFRGTGALHGGAKLASYAYGAGLQV